MTDTTPGTDQPHTAIVLEDRGVLAIGGADSRTFLQGLISNDINQVSADQAIHAALLTPQGKYLFDFFIVEADGVLLFDCEAARLDELAKKLRMYKLRSDVTIEDRSDALTVMALIGDGASLMLTGDGVASALNLKPDAGSAAPFGGELASSSNGGVASPSNGGVAYVDPRLADIGARAMVTRDEAIAAIETAGFTVGERADYDALRLTLGLPDGSRDLEVDKSILLESGFDELNGVDWNKGCYMGQELTARTKYRGLIKKRLVPVEIDGTPPEPGTPVMAGDREAGTLRSVSGNRGIALIRLEYLEAKLMTDKDTTIRPHVPDWMALAPEAEPSDA